MFIFIQKVLILFYCFMLIFGAFGTNTSSSYPGVTQLYTKNLSDSAVSVGSAVFVNPDTLITTNHQLLTLLDPDDPLNLFFTHPETKALEPITQIQLLDFQSDIVILKTKRPSKYFHPLSDQGYLQWDSNSNSRKIILAGFPFDNFTTIKGQIWNQYQYLTTAEIFTNTNLYGISGGAVFQENTGELIGIVISGSEVPVHIRFISSVKIKDLLSIKRTPCNNYTDCFEQQVRTVLQAIKKNNYVAQHGFAWFNLKLCGKYCPHEVYSLLAQAAESHYIPAMFDLCTFIFSARYEINKTVEEGISICEKVADQGDIAAMYLLGEIYLTGRGDVSPDFVQAGRWFKRSIGGGNVQAQIILGLMHFLGKGVKKDYSKAVCLLQSSVPQIKILKTGNIDIESIKGFLDFLVSEGYTCSESGFGNISQSGKKGR